MFDACSNLTTDSQLVRTLRVSVRWLRAEADAGRLPSLKAERRYLFNREVVERILAERAALERRPVQQSTEQERRSSNQLNGSTVTNGHQDFHRKS